MPKNQSRSLIVVFGLELELVLVVRLVKSVKPDITVLAAARVAVAVRVEHDCVDWAEVTLDAAELFLEHHVEEARVELANPRGRSCHVHRLLATAEHDL